MLIYMVVNNTNNMIYIGQTSKSLVERRNAHYSRAKSSNTYFHRALKKYDKTNFEWLALEIVSEVEINQSERFWIEYFKSIGAILYNLALGGEGSMRGYKHSIEARMKNSMANKGRKVWNKGIPTRDETKAKLRVSTLARQDTIQSEENRNKNALGVSKGKRYRIIGPDGTIYDNVINVSEFARQHDLNIGLLHYALKKQNRMKSHKGYSGDLITEQ